MREKPTCPECGEDEEYSVWRRMRSRTQIARSPGHWDEDGTYHPPGPDPNTTYQYYHCSNGHTWKEKVGSN